MLFLAVFCGLQGECKYTIVDEGHSEWVSCVRFSPSPTAPVIVSCGWDKRVKVSTTYLHHLVLCYL